VVGKSVKSGARATQVVGTRSSERMSCVGDLLSSREGWDGVELDQSPHLTVHHIGPLLLSSNISDNTLEFVWANPGEGEGRLGEGEG